jgi:hypothetical protein
MEGKSRKNNDCEGGIDDLQSVEQEQCSPDLNSEGHR